MGATRDLLDGLFALITAGGITHPGYASGYRDGPGAPDVQYVLSDYSTADDPAAPQSTVLVQVKTRSAVDNPTAGIDLDDDIAQVLLGRYPVTLDTGVRVLTIARTFGTPLGRDQAGRWERTSNYDITVHRPGPFRL